MTTGHRPRLRTMLVTAGMALAALLAVPAALPAASAAIAQPARAVAVAVPNAGSYHYDQGYACGDYKCHSTGFISLHSTNTSTQIWINGTPSCAGYNGVTITWCGFTQNGTSVLDTGFNFNAGGHSYWYRFDIHAAGYCTVRGNAPGTMAWTYCLQ